MRTWASWTMQVICPDRSTRLVRQEEVVNDCRSKAKNKSSKRLFEVVQKHEMRLGRKGSKTREGVRAPVEAETRQTEA